MADNIFESALQKYKHIVKFTKGSILEIGCGIGLLASCVGDREYTGIDSAQLAVQFASKKYTQDNISFICTDIDSWDTYDWFSRNRQYDTVVFTDVLENANTPEKLLKRFAKLANKQAVIVLPYNHGRKWNGKSVRKLVTQAGRIIKLSRFNDEEESWWLIIIEPWRVVNDKKK